MVVRSPSYPTWLGWVGILGGAGSLVIGLLMYLGPTPAGVYVSFAVLVSLFMAAGGVLLWRAAGASMPGSPAMA